MIVAISGKSIAKGLVSAFFGMLLCTVGLDPTNGIPRFITYKQTGLLEGFQFIPTLIGLFAVAEVIAGVERIIRDEEKAGKLHEKDHQRAAGLADHQGHLAEHPLRRHHRHLHRRDSGAGGDIAVFVSYGFNKSPEQASGALGHGHPERRASTESANNGCRRRMIPLLSPRCAGRLVTAILLGAFIMKGYSARSDDVHQRTADRLRSLRR